MNLLNIINPSFADIYCSTVLPNHSLFRFIGQRISFAMEVTNRALAWRRRRSLRGWLVCGWAQPGSHAACRPAGARLVRYHSRLIGLRMQEYRSSWDAVWLLACLTQKWFSVSARFPMRSRLHHRSLVPRKRPICSFLQSLAERHLLHARSLVEEVNQ